MHVISSCTKPIASWTARDAIQECREACGGHGYLKGNLKQFIVNNFFDHTYFILLLAARFNELRSENDANCTYEGDNNVLMQQTSNWLLNIWSKILMGDKSSCDTPLGTIEFLKDADTILSEKFKLSRTDEVFIHKRM